jgi:hypothetical protein
MRNKLSQWHDLVGRLLDINLGEELDKFVWQLHKNGSFLVQSMYNHLVNNGVKVTQEIWRMKLPLKIKIFLWFLKKGITLTKDNLAKRNWNGSKVCSFCSSMATIKYLFFDCIVTKVLWRMVHCVFV